VRLASEDAWAADGPAFGEVAMQPLRHSYTNDTRGDGRVVVKRYEGPDAAVRRDCERQMLRKLGGILPLPALVDAEAVDQLRMEFVPGVHGQELIEAGMAGPVLRACGRMLRRVHEVDVAELFPAQSLPAGAVLVHGDYGPNNMLLDSTTFAVTAVLDWEWAHPGAAIEDLAWCEWIVRMHHRPHVQALDGFFDAYGWRPAWDQRQAAMVARCQQLLDMCRRWSPDAVRVWQDRVAVTAGWVE
jgi:aminoglycoside phosphotransferase